MRTGTRIGRVQAAGLSFLAAACVLDPPVPAGAAVDGSADGAASAAGRWTLLLNETNRQCRLTLRTDPVAKMYRMGLPAGCRRAIPILSSVGGWTTAGKAVQFDDDDGKPVLEFTASGEVSGLVAKGPEGEVYSLVSLETTRIAAAAREPVAVQTAPPAGASWEVLLAQATVPDAAPKALAAGAGKSGAPGPADIPGRYSILRKGGKDTGCMLTLDAKAKGPKGGKKANLAPACKDHGIVIFDPKGWRLEDGRLTLTAKKGHETHLDFQSDGSWLKDPKEGTPLSLRKS